MIMSSEWCRLLWYTCMHHTGYLILGACMYALTHLVVLVSPVDLSGKRIRFLSRWRGEWVEYESKCNSRSSATDSFRTGSCREWEGRVGSGGRREGVSGGVREGREGGMVRREGEGVQAAYNLFKITHING